MTFDNEQQRVAQMMRRYGGDFMSAIGKALECADPTNAARIKAAWPDEWQRFLKMQQWEEDQQR